MRLSSELLLTFLLNATWQIFLIAAAASLASWLLRETSARYRHLVWVSALILAFLIPLLAIATQVVESEIMVQRNQPGGFATEVPLNPVLPEQLTVPDEPTLNLSFQLNPYIALILITGYLSLIGFRVIRFGQAWRYAIKVRRTAHEVVDDDCVRLVLAACEEQLGRPKRNVKVLTSSLIQVPVTFGFFHPVIILPEDLLIEGNIELLRSAIGHEYVHVGRRDYLLNLIYELLYIPLSFHPAAGLIRRCIKQTRELCCDALVAQRIITPEAYARSLVKLAGSAPTLRRLSVTTTVGIADADILEARIMSLLKRPRIDPRWKTIALVVVSLLLTVPCVAAATFAVRFEMQPSDDSLVQEPVYQEREFKEQAQEKQKAKEELKVQIASLKRSLEVAAQESTSQEQEKVKQRLLETAKIKRKIEQLQSQLAVEDGERASAMYAEMEKVERRSELEVKAKIVMQAALVRLARIQMDQAIQIATSAHHGKVLACTLNGEGWEEPGKLSPDGRIFYHVVVVSGDESNQVHTHVLVNAIDGSIIRAEKELPRKMRRAEP